MLVSGAALLLACTAFAAYELADFRQTLVQGLSIQSQIVGANSASALLFNDPDSARNTLSALKAAPNILSATIYTPSGNGTLFATYLRENSPAPESYPHCLGCQRASWKRISLDRTSWCLFAPFNFKASESEQ